MYTKNIFKIITLLLSSGIHCAYSSELDARDDVGYIKQGNYAGGWANVSPATQGNYANGASKPTVRPTPVFLVGKPVRQEYIYLSAQEQDDLWHYRQSMREAMKKAALLTQSAVATPKPVNKNIYANVKINWPRVTVQGKKVCVPVLSYSEAADWKDHLVCTELGEIK